MDDKKDLANIKRATTREIKGLEEHLKDLEEQKSKQGNQYQYDFRGRKCDRWMYQGEWFFPSTILRLQRDIKKLKEQRQQLDSYVYH